MSAQHSSPVMATLNDVIVSTSSLEKRIDDIASEVRGHCSRNSEQNANIRAEISEIKEMLARMFSCMACHTLLHVSLHFSEII